MERRMEEFNYPPSSSNTQSIPLNFRIPAELHRMLVELFDSKKFPYRTFSDLERHAMFKHVEYLNNHSGARHNINYLQAMVIVLNKESEITDFQQIMDKLRIQVHVYQENGYREDAARIVNIILGTIAGMPDTQSKRMYEERIRGEFGHYAGKIVEAVRVELVSYDPEDMEKEE